MGTMTTGLARKGKRGQPEYADQKALFAWAKARSATLPELKLLVAIPNSGGYRGGFKANAIRATRDKAAGVAKGFPDIFLPIPRNGYHGMFVELKAGKNKPTADQAAWFKALVEQGYVVRVCYSWTEASQALLCYLGVTGDV